VAGLQLFWDADVHHSVAKDGLQLSEMSRTTNRHEFHEHLPQVSRDPRLHCAIFSNAELY
jgi:hypothetical protein